MISYSGRKVSEKAEIIANVEVIRQTLCRTDTLEEEKSILENEMAALAGMVQDVVGENARIAQEQGEYQARYGRLVGRHDAAKARYDEVVRTIAEQAAKSERLEGFIKVLQEQDGVIVEFDERLWSSMVDFEAPRFGEVLLSFIKF